MKLRTWWDSAHLLIFVGAMLGVFILLYAIASRADRRIDVTGDRRFTLTETSERILDAVKEPVSLFAFYHADMEPSVNILKDLLEGYRARNSNVSFELIELDRHPLKAEQFGVKRYGEVVLVMGERRERTSDWSEDSITSALLRLERRDETKVYFLSGHGEPSLESTERDGLGMLGGELGRLGYHPVPLNFEQSKRVPEDAALLVIVSPRSDLYRDDIDAIETYVNGGGSLFCALDPVMDTEKTQILETLLEQYGISAGHDVVVDSESHAQSKDYLVPVVTQFSRHDITRGLAGAWVLPLARSIRSREVEKDTLKTTILATSSPESWSETDLGRLEEGKAVFDEGDGTFGFVPLAALSEGNQGPAAERAFRVLAVGDGDFLRNAHVRIGGNLDFVLSAVAWLSRREMLVGIETREPVATPLYLTRTDRWYLFLSMVLFVPLSVFLAGVYVNVRRHRLA